MKNLRLPDFRDHFALWFSLGASLYLMPFGALLVPALSIERAVLAAAIGGLLGGLCIASIAALAAASGRSTLDLLAGAFGGPARRPLALLLTARHLLFAVFALVIIGDAAGLVSERTIGAGLRPVWVVLFAAAALGLVALGTGRTLSLLRRAGLWLVLLVALGVTASAYAEFEIPAYLKRPAVGGWPSFWQAVDLMLVFPLLWLPVVADFARKGNNPGQVAAGSLAGVFVASVWFGVLGVLYLPATDSGDIPGFVVGMQLGLAALVPLFLLQVDEVYAAVASGLPAAREAAAGRTERLAAPAFMLVAAAAALALHISDVEAYALLAASAFVPAGAVIIVRGLASAPRTWAVSLVAWASGFVLYQWISPADAGWWQDGLDAVAGAIGIGFPASGDTASLGAAIPAFVLTAAIELAALLPGALQQRRLSQKPASGA